MDGSSDDGGGGMLWNGKNPQRIVILEESLVFQGTKKKKKKKRDPVKPYYGSRIKCPFFGRKRVFLKLSILCVKCWNAHFLGAFQHFTQRMLNIKKTCCEGQTILLP